MTPGFSFVIRTIPRLVRIDAALIVRIVRRIGRRPIANETLAQQTAVAVTPIRVKGQRRAAFRSAHVGVHRERARGHVFEADAGFVRRFEVRSFARDADERIVASVSSLMHALCASALLD